jgi:hypothetical protein
MGGDYAGGGKGGYFRVIDVLKLQFEDIPQSLVEVIH